MLHPQASIDSALIKSGVRFLPWIGAKYWHSLNGLRTLVLGESHYDSPSEGDISQRKDFTRECIEEQIEGELTRAFWTNIAATLAGKNPISLQEKAALWARVAFYNYVQTSAGKTARQSPSTAAWDESTRPLRALLDELKPQFIVALGYRLYDHLPDLNGRSGPRVENAPQKGTWLYPHKEGSALLYTIRHPSAGFSSPEWHIHILAAAQLARFSEKSL